MVQSIDHVALLPAYLAAGTAVLVLLADLLLARRAVTFAVAAIGAAATGAAAAWVASLGERETFCLPGGCSFVADGTGAVVAVVFSVLTLGVIGLSWPALRGDAEDPGAAPPTGEYLFLLACSLTGGVVLAYARDLITIIVALETLTLPLYALVGLRRKSVASAESAVNFLVVSVISSAVTLMGAALLYAVTGAVHLDQLRHNLGGPVTDVVPDYDPGAVDLPLTSVAVILVLVGIAFKIAAVPFHAWAPATYDGAPLPVAAYLSTASKLGGVFALLLIAVGGLRPALDRSGFLLAAVAVATMTVGNLAALRQTRMVRLLAFSSIAQAGYILAPLGVFAAAAGREQDVVDAAVTATLAYTVFYVVLELAAFAVVIAVRGSRQGGLIADYAGLARRSPVLAGAFVLALVGLAGLPPGMAGLFAKVTVVDALLEGEAVWLAVVVAVNAVIGLVYYVRVAGVLVRAPEGAVAAPGPRVPWPVALTLGAATVAGVVLGFAPQLVLTVTGG
ncbi:NADH-quinone oxidoreductase subunit N [Phytomonospora sp. NPDC050363]|uniref:NADH-quinone oxidoreductase subunit N n=1 Tax=Phytomonospora sp. NPDC050363 TaxID=3155642 RepID=UPI00340B4EC9